MIHSSKFRPIRILPTQTNPDYQARRMKLRYKDAEGRMRVPYTLNGSGTALPRLYVALLEQNQQPDGTVRIPRALVPYFGQESLAPAATGK